MDFGILTLLPIVVVIIMSLLTKRILESLIAGLFVTYMMIDAFGFAAGWMEANGSGRPGWYTLRKAKN